MENNISNDFEDINLKEEKESSTQTVIEDISSGVDIQKEHNAKPDFEGDIVIDKLPDEFGELVNDIQQTINEPNSLINSPKNEEEVQEILGELKQKIKNITESIDSIDNPEDFLLTQIKRNVGEVAVILEDIMEMMITNKNDFTPTTSLLRTIGELVKTKNEALLLLSNYLINKEKVGIEKIKLNMVDNEINTFSNQESLNELIEKRVNKELNEDDYVSSIVENIDIHNDEMVKEAEHIEKFDGKLSSSFNEKTNKHVEIDDINRLLEKDFTDDS